MNNPPALLISKATQRRFILGKQGLHPGRRWRGKEGVVQAVREGCVVQVDPLNVVARSHDIALYGRVHDYQPSHLDAALYTDRTLFDFGGTVMIHPMEELPYWRVVMERKQNERRWAAFAEEHADVIREVQAAVEERGPLGTRDLGGASMGKGSFRSGKVTGQALYYLWLSGDLMTHSRRGFERIYDLRERVAPPGLDHAAGVDETEDYFALRLFHQLNVATARSWRGWFSGAIERQVSAEEASGRLGALLKEGKIAQVALGGDEKVPRFVLAEDVPLLETLQASGTPAEWQPLATSSSDEMVFLAPLEIVSTRGRALPLFDFEYLWEVYKPAEKRRWGYYTLPILYGDQLVARLDPKLDRDTGTLHVKGFWLEEGVTVDKRFALAFDTALNRFMHFVGADSVDLPESLRETVTTHLRGKEK